MSDDTRLFEKHIAIDNGDKTVVDWLAENTSLSRQRIKQVMIKGAVWFTRGKKTRRIRRARKMLLPGDKLHLYYDEKILSMEPATAELVADESAYTIWYKPRGMLSQGSKWGDHCAINRYVEQQLQSLSVRLPRDRGGARQSPVVVVAVAARRSG